MVQVANSKYTIHIYDSSGLLRVLVVNNLTGTVMMTSSCQGRPGPITVLNVEMGNIIRDAVVKYTCNEVKTNCRPAAAFVYQLKFGG